MSAAELSGPKPSASEPTSAAPRRSRLESVDLLRGLVMVLMALDHVRDHVHRGATTYDPTDLTQASAALFLTRWVTHFCAPVFVFLAGTGAYLSGARGQSRASLSRFLLTRGLWLVLLETTVINAEWQFHFNLSQIIIQVIWVLGWGMVLLSGLVFLPVAVIAGIGVVMIAGHNALDGMKPAAWASFAWAWQVLHVPGPLAYAPGRTLFIIYPLVPWIGAMATGYAFGALLTGPPESRRRTLVALGAGLTAAFIVLRAINGYGDPRPWAPQRSPLFTTLSFLNCEKYPPSLLFLLMTLGPSILLLAGLERGIWRLARPLIVFGRVPLFYYVLHLFLIDVMAIGFATAQFGGRAKELFAKGTPPEYGYGLPVVYLAWMGLVVLLFPICRWYAALKARSRARILSYL